MIEWDTTPVDVKTLCSRQDVFPILARFPATEDKSEPHPATTGEDADVREGTGFRLPVSYLLFSVRKCIKVSGTSLRWDDGEKALSKNGINYVIPVSYPGWFRILSNDSQSQSSIISLTSIEQVVASKSTSILVHSCVTGLRPTDALSTMTTTSKRDSFEEVRVPPGEVLTCGPVFVEPQEDPLKKLYRRFCLPCRNKDTQPKEKMYLHSRATTSGINILLPLETYGQFSRVGSSQSNSSGSEEDLATIPTQLPVVYQIKDLVNRKDFPQKVQLVFGTPPSGGPQPGHSFTGLISLGNVYSEESIIACQIAAGCRLAFLEFPDDSDVEFLLANNWETATEDASVLKAIDFCQLYSDAYKLEIQPIIESNQLHKISAQQHDDFSTDVFKSGTYRKGGSDTGTHLESFHSQPDTATNPTSPQTAAPASPRPQSGVTVPTTPQSETVLPTVAQRPEFVPRILQHGAAFLNASRSRVANKSVGRRQDRNSLHDISTADETINTNAAKRPNVAPISLPSSPEECSVVQKLPVRFTNSLDARQLNKDAIALVHTPSPYVPDPSARKPHRDYIQNIAQYSSGRLTERKLPPLPAQTEAVKPVEESNQRCRRISSEVESNASDPERLYERIPHQQRISNEPSASAPSSPAPTIRNLKATSIAVPPSAYDQDGYLTPVELRGSAPVSERGRERISSTGVSGNTGNCKKKLGQNNSTVHRKYLNCPLDQIPFDRRCDPERLQSFLDDSVAELDRKELHRRFSERTTDTNRERYYRRNNSFHQGTPPYQSTLRSLSISSCSNYDIAHHRDESDAYLDTILYCEDADEDYSPRFLRQFASTSLRMRRYDSSAVASYHGFDSAAFSDSGIASRRSTMRKENGQLANWKQINVSWMPPEDLSSLTVEEVAMSLRYIGMKDRIVASFSKELVDGKLLCEMNNHLLTEGFPHMNSLERKKVLDFVKGWRPKRLLFI